MSSKSKFSKEYRDARTALESRFEAERQQNPNGYLVSTKRILVDPAMKEPRISGPRPFTRDQLKDMYDPEYSEFETASKREFDA